MPRIDARGSHLFTREGDRLWSEARRANYLFVDSADKLPEAVDGVHLLPADTLVEISGAVDLGANSVELSNGTVVVGRDINHDQLISSTTGAVVIANSLESNCILRECNIVATQGQCIDLIGGGQYQHNMFYVGMFGASAGRVRGFDVQAVKSCFVDCAEGLRFEGPATNKLFIDGTPFYGITGAAITLGESLENIVIDIGVCFFKFDSPGVALRAEEGYSPVLGLYTRNLIDGTAIPLDGVSPADPQWKMSNNTGVRDSRVLGVLTLNEPTTVTISEQNTPTRIVGASTLSELSERFESDNNGRLTYAGVEPALVSVALSLTVDGGNNVDGAVFVGKNGTALEESRIDFRIGTGGDERTMTTFGVFEVVTGDHIDAYIENQDSTSNFTAQTMLLRSRS